MAKIIECVPNFSEGRDKNVIDQIVKAIASAKVTVNGNEEGVKVLDVDPGEATARILRTRTSGGYRQGGVGLAPVLSRNRILVVDRLLCAGAE